MKFKTIWVESGYGYNTQQPFIEIKDERIKPGEKIQLSPEEARDLAMNLLEAAEAAEQDAFIIDYVKKQIVSPGTSKEESDKMAAGFLFEFREWRKKYGMNK